MIKVDQLKLKVGYSQVDLLSAVAKAIRVLPGDIKDVEILKESIDARRKPNVFYVLSVAVDVDDCKLKIKGYPEVLVDKSGLCYSQVISSKRRPVIIGFGPSGMFCALALAKMGLKPLVVEQGERVEERIKTVNNFWENGILNKNSNVQFGEGGAGTFSDGKLNSNVSNKYCKKVLNEFILHGSPKDIFYKSKPHIGSDKLPNVVKSIRNEIISLGGTILFDTKFVDYKKIDNYNFEINLQNVKTGTVDKEYCSAIVLCAGHSARDLFLTLEKHGVKMSQKPFAIGVRVEQLQEDINISQYGEGYDKRLPPADYKLFTHLRNGRSVFTFCMCPGGRVVSSSSDEGCAVTNGMSNYARNGKFANSAVLVNIMPEDFFGTDIMAGVKFQEKYEKLAYMLAGASKNLPCQCYKDFVIGQLLNAESCLQNVESSIPLKNLQMANIKDCMPDYVYESLKMGLIDFNKKIKNFTRPNSLLYALETRTSSPITILRNENYMSSEIGIFPCGEGSGYAGGIITSAQDGIRVAEAVARYLKND